METPFLPITRAKFLMSSHRSEVPTRQDQLLLLNDLIALTPSLCNCFIVVELPRCVCFWIKDSQPRHIGIQPSLPHFKPGRKNAIQTKRILEQSQKTGHSCPKLLRARMKTSASWHETLWHNQLRHMGKTGDNRKTRSNGWWTFSYENRH